MYPGQKVKRSKANRTGNNMLIRKRSSLLNHAPGKIRIVQEWQLYLSIGLRPCQDGNCIYQAGLL
jgi:hypothetical protein